MGKKKIMVIKAGGTVCEKPNKKGFLEIPKEGQDYFHLIQNINDLANITEIEISPIDSTNMALHHRKKFADMIKNNYQKQDGFVIIQGTDTLAESAISMNYMIQNLGKPIIFTGAQKPIYVENTDAIENIKNSILVATENIGESAIVFDNKIIRGSRAVKRHSEDFFGFYSPKIEEIGKIEKEKIKFNNQIKRKFYLKPEIFTNFKKNVLYYSQISGADTNLLEKIVKDCDCHGLIIGGYGTGNINSKYLKAIELATESGKPVAITTACQYGKTDKKYAVGSEAIERGAFLAYDLTKEAASQKMMYALGIVKSKKKSKKDTIKEVKEIIQTPIGEDLTKE